jgi:hypothetical protein
MAMLTYLEGVVMYIVDLHHIVEVVKPRYKGESGDGGGS